MSFELPELYINPEFSWGPPQAEMTQEDGAPIELYSKKDALTGVDWFSQMKQDRLDDEEEEDNNYGGGKKKNFVAVEDDARLNALRNERAKAQTYKSHKNVPINARNAAMLLRKTGANNASKGFQRRNQNEQHRQQVELLNTYNFSAVAEVLQVLQQTELNKATMSPLPTVQDIGNYGTPFVYSGAMDKATAANPAVLDESNYKKEFFTRPLISEDTVVRSIMRERQDYPRVVVSDEILSLLMVSSRSSYPWHIRIISFSNIFILEKTDESGIDQQWVSETAPRYARPSEGSEAVEERISSLGAESTQVHNSFIRASCSKSCGQVKAKANPFSNIQQRMYRYRRFTMHEGTPDRYDIIVRCEVDAVMPRTYETVRSFALLEQCMATEKPKTWRRSGAVGGAAFLPQEYANNGCKISRWVALSLLSDVKHIKIGFVTCEEKPERTRTNFNHKKHVVIGVQSYSPQSLAHQLGLNVGNMWAIVDSVLRPFINGTALCPAVLMKPGDKAELIAVEEESDDEDEEEEEEEEDEEDEDEDDE